MTTHAVWLVVWQFLNQNFVSSACGALIFGFIAALLLRHYTGVREAQELGRRLRLLLADEVRRNQQISRQVRDALAKNRVAIEPEPFQIASLRTSLQGKFVETMSPELAIKLSEFYEVLETSNQLHSNLNERTAGVLASFTNAAQVRQQVRDALLQSLDKLDGMSSDILDDLH